MVRVLLNAHWFGFGTNVYVVVAKLFRVGDHCPAMLFIEVDGKGCKIPPAQIDGT